VSADDSGNGTGIWGMARLAGPALVALVLAGVALPWILDSGTVHLPAIGVGVTTGSGSGPAAVAKIVVAPSKSTGTHHHSHSSAASVAPAQTSKPTTEGSSPVGGQAVASPVVQPAHQSSSGAKRTAKPPSPVTKPNSGSGTSTPPPNTNGQGNGGQGNEGGNHGPPAQSPAAATHPGRALGHQKHGFLGKAAQDKGTPPRGLALGHRDHVPPGQARKESRPPHGLALGHRDHVPPGQARKQSESHGHSSESHGHGGNARDQSRDDQGQNSGGSGGHDHGSHGHHGDTPSDQANGAHGTDSHGRGNGH
jgi:hypothetical protein